MSAIGTNGSNLAWKPIRDPKRLFVRFQRKEDKEEAKKAERDLLNRYEWNEL